MRELHPLGKITFPYLQPNVITNPSTGGGGALGYYGSFYDTTSQTLASTTTEYVIGINTTLEYNGVTIVGGSKITFANAGVYNIQFSIQLASSDTSIHDASIWLRKNGVDVPYSTGMVSVPNRHGGIDGKIISAWNYVMTIAAGDYIEFWWQAESTNVYIAAVPAGTTPTTPITPSIIVTAQQVMNTQIGVSKFTALTDVPSSYTGQASNYVRVNSGETALEFATLPTNAPTNASYLVLGTNATLTNERVLTAGTGITLTDGGAGGNLTIASSVTGTVTSVAATVPSILTLSGTPITTSGTLAFSLATQTANKVFAGPTSGSAAAPTFRSLVAADLPAYVMSHLRRRATSHPARGATGRTVVGATGGTPTGTVGNTTDASDGSFQPWTSAATSGSFAGGFILANGATGSDLRLDNLPVVVIRFKTDAALTNVRYLIGLSSAAIGTSDTPSSTSTILIRYSTSASDTGWIVYSSNGTSGTATGQVLAIAANTAYTLMIRATTSSNVEIWMGTSETDLALVSTVTATLPSASTSLIGILQLTTLTTVSRIMQFGHYDQSSI